MKVQFTENEGCFAIQLDAENMQEAAQLVRFGMNRTDKLTSCGTNVFQDHNTSTHVVFAKNRRANSDIPRRK